MLLPSNITSNSLKSPSDSEGDSSGLMLTVPVNSGATLDHQKNFVLVTSLSLCNKTEDDISVSAKVVNGSTSAQIVNGMSIPPHVPYDLIHGNKFTLKEGDMLYVWHDNDVDPSPLDAMLSYTLHKPLTLYDV